MRQLPLTAKAYTVLNSEGNGTAYVGPQSYREQWTGLTASVRASTNVNEATCSVYAGAAATPGYFSGATTWGSTGDSTTNLATVQLGGNVFAVWTGGDPGATAYLTVTGTKSVT